ncbi:MAG: hypothetical protein OXB88_11110 [Bacteriovoracales bacterium]|nr:hypothetical protein [Bacteriovoracales bacterium]
MKHLSLIILLFAPLFTWAQCLIPFEERGQVYTQFIQRHEKMRSSYEDLFPQSLMVNSQVDMSSEEGILSANVEGFLRLGEREFVLIPIMGLGLYMSKNDVAYYCVHLDPEKKDPYLEISFLNRSTLNKISRVFKKKNKRRSKYANTNIGLDMAPLSDVANKIEAGLDSVPVIGPIYKGINQGIFDHIFLAMRKTINFIFKAGVYKIRIDKNGLTVWTQARIFKIVSYDFKISEFDLENNFFKDIAASSESDDYDVYSRELSEEEKIQQQGESF